MIVKRAPVPTNGQQDNGCARLIDHVYPSVRGGPQIAECEFLAKCAILASHNREVMEINEEILKLIPDNKRTYLSVDSITNPTGVDLIPVKYFNRLNPNGWPPHRLSHKVGTPMMLLRNLDRVNNLCNCMRLFIKWFAQRVIEAEVMTGDHKGHIAFVPRIPLTFEDAGLPYKIKHKAIPCLTCVRYDYQQIPRTDLQTCWH
jgi:hypothetical protein